MKRIDHATVVAYVALFAALAGGAAYAAEKIGSNQIEPNAVLAKHIKAKAVRGAEVANGSLSAADLEPDARRPAGPAGGDLSGDYPDPQIGANAVGADEVGADALGGAEIDERSLEVVRASADESLGAGACCETRAEVLDAAATYDPAQSETFVDLGDIELRSGGSAAVIEVCNTGATEREPYVYFGGIAADTSENRLTPNVGPGGCESIDINDGQIGGSSDFRIIDPHDRSIAVGASESGPLQVLVTSW